MASPKSRVKMAFPKSTKATRASPKSKSMKAKRVIVWDCGPDYDFNESKHDRHDLQLRVFYFGHGAGTPVVLPLSDN